MQRNRFNWTIRIIYLFEFLKNLQFFGSVAILFYLDWAKLDYTRAFVLEASFVLFMFLLDVPTGALADKFGRKFSLAAGGVFAGIGFALFGLVNSYPIFFFANFICAIGFSLFSGADRALLYDTLLAQGKKDDARHYFSRSDAFATAGLLIAFPVGSMIAGSSSVPYPKGLPLTFILSGGSFVLAGLAALMIPEAPRKEFLRNPVQESLAGFLFLFNHKEMRLYSFNFALISAVTFFVYWFYQKVTGLAGLQVSINGFIGAGFNLFGLILLWNVSRLEKQFRLKPLLFFTAFIPGILFIGLGFTFAPYYSLPAIFLIAGMKQLRAPLLSDLMNQLIDSRNRATVLSGVSMLERGIMFLLYPLVGVIADHSLPWTFITLGCITLVFLILSRIPKEHIL